MLYGNAGRDEIVGGAGDDSLIGGSSEGGFGLYQRDTLTGGEGADSFFLGFDTLEIPAPNLTKTGNLYTDGPNEVGDGKFESYPGSQERGRVNPDLNPKDFAFIVILNNFRMI